MRSRRASTKGFTRTSSLLTQRVRTASEKRGFAQSRLLTQWTEVAGEAMAAISRPVEVSYGRGGMGATLTLLTTGANAPMLEMEKEKLRGRVNAVYGYNAIARIRITQTAATGFAEGQVDFQHGPDRTESVPTNPEIQQKALEVAEPIEDEGLKRALARLGENILKKTNR
ncbi:MAG: DciA family protein [Roseobacter sp.]